jgi:hypothetical protein
MRAAPLPAGSRSHYIGAMRAGLQPHRVAALVCAWAAATHGVLSAREPSARDLAERAAAYVRGLDEQLVSIVGRERHEQRSVEGTGGAAFVERRVLDARISWVHIAAVNDTFAVREVLSVDDEPTMSTSPLEQMLKAPPDVLSERVRALLDESASHNLASGTRNINFPTFALVYLRPENVRRSRWRLLRREGALTVLSFEERERPARVRSDTGEHLWSRGRVWLDASSGRVERTEVRLGSKGTDAARRGSGQRATTVEMKYQQQVSFAHDERLDIWLPKRMTDAYEGLRGATKLRVEGDARYSDYRRFETEGRLLVR